MPRFGYFSAQELAPNLWEIKAQWSNKLGRRMTVIRLGDKRLVVHNPIELAPKEISWLESLGTVSSIVAPNIFHCSDAGWMAKEFPEATLFVPAKKIATFRKKGFNPKDLNVDFRDCPELLCIPMQGAWVEEAAFLHKPSRTLILCDLAFNMADLFTGFEKVVMKWNKVGGRFGPSRLTRLLFANDPRQLASSYRRLLGLDFDRVVVNHGDVLQTGGRARLEESVNEIFGSP